MATPSEKLADSLEILKGLEVGVEIFGRGCRFSL